MGLDIRLPIGMMFSLIGALLAVYGACTGDDSEMYQSSLGTDINLWWGLTLFAFGAVMLLFAIMSRLGKSSPPTE